MRSQPVHKNQNGFSTVEILVAFAVIILTFTAVIGLVFGGQSVTVDGRTNSEATQKALAMLEEARAQAVQDFNQVNPIPAAPDPTDPMYQKSQDVSMVGLYTKKVTSKVTWNADGGRSETVQLSTLLTNYSGIVGGNADTCNSVLAGDWTQPQMTSYELGKDLMSDPNSDYIVNDIKVLDQKMYVGARIDHANNTFTFFEFNLSDPIHPSLIAAIPNDSDPHIKAGINAITPVGKYIYAAKATGPSNGQLQTIDVSVIPPQIIKTYKVPGVTGSSNYAVGHSIYYKNGYVYLGLTKTTTGPEFNIIDVGGGGAPASPTNPIWKGGYTIGNVINAILVKDKYAYLATPIDDELIILDISNPSNPTLVGGFNAPGGGGNNGNGKSLYLVGDNLFLGRTELSGNELYILDDSNPETYLPVLGSKDIKNGGNNLSVNGIIIRDYLAFLIAYDEFEVWKIDQSTAPWTLTQWAAPIPFPEQGGGNSPGTATDCEGNYIYVSSVPTGNGKGSISIITGKP